MARSRDAGDGGPGDGRAGLGLLGGSVRRDLADLNLRHLEYPLDGPDPSDPLVSWSPDVVREIALARPEVLARMAGCPFSLFELRLPEANGCVANGTGVRDATAVATPRAARCPEFARTALFAAWRMADSAPLAARIVFGLTPPQELLLNELPSRSPPDVARPRSRSPWCA